MQKPRLASDAVDNWYSDVKLAEQEGFVAVMIVFFALLLGFMYGLTELFVVSFLFGSFFIAVSLFIYLRAKRKLKTCSTNN